MILVIVCVCARKGGGGSVVVDLVSLSVTVSNYVWRLDTDSARGMAITYRIIVVGCVQ